MNLIQNFIFFSTLVLTGFGESNVANAKTVHYDLTLENRPVNLSGKKQVDFALTVNGSIPAPTLTFTESDEAEITVHNRIQNQESSIHWHGILLPNEMDGVPNVTTPPIASGADFTYRFPIRQHGTYWYHSHTMTQEQEGVLGAIIIHPKKKSKLAERDEVVVLSDWVDEPGAEVLKNLRKDGDYYLFKKGTVRSWLGAFQSKHAGDYFKNEWTRMGGMDPSDVGYDAFLMNGMRAPSLGSLQDGERVRLRIINAGASTYFRVSLGSNPMTVVAADGIEIVPIKTNFLFMGMAETYDVLVTGEAGKKLELRASAQDGTGSVSGWIGDGTLSPALIPPAPDLYAPMNHDAHAEHGAQPHAHAQEHGHGHHSGHEAPSEAPLTPELTVDHLHSPVATDFPENLPRRSITLALGGDMRRYIWHLNGKAIHEERNLDIHSGEIVRLTFKNETMMHHPMHLHGHFFRVLTEAGKFSPLKHTVDVPPHSSRTIEFYANEPGEWMLHCHNLYHMTTGMARVLKYDTFKPTPELAHLQHLDHHLHDPFYFSGSLELASNHAQASLKASQTWNEWLARIETRNTSGKNFSYSNPWEVEADLLYRRWIDSFFYLTGGALLFDRKTSAGAGIGYTLPLLIDSELLINHEAELRLSLSKQFQWTRLILSEVQITWRPNQSVALSRDWEYEATLLYKPTWAWSAGLMLTDRNLGLGVQTRF